MCIVNTIVVNSHYGSRHQNLSTPRRYKLGLKLLNETSLVQAKHVGKY
jgi:hypothetical protein